jgi:tRNA-specific 2-thiouridylase
LDKIVPDNKKRKRVVVAMSGGVDSSVAAAVCAKQGYDVIGVTLQLYKNDVVGKKKGSCCAGQDIYDAKKVADRIGIKHYVLDYEEQFKSEVIDDFTNSYANGLTPIPCVRCNEKIKFRDLYQTAKQLGASTLITGHYVSNKFMNGERALFRARDSSKDQSYFMFTLKKEQLDFIRFPLGDLTKEQTREIARELDLSIAEKPDSQDICFVQEGRYTNLINKLLPKSTTKGNIVNMSGEVVGEHDGIVNFTIGQRRGIGYASGIPNYVIDIDSQSLNVMIGPKECLGVNQIILDEVNWLGPNEIFSKAEYETPIFVKVRSTSDPVEAKLSKKNNQILVELKNPEYGVAPGQACVFYDSIKPISRILGGGWIVKNNNKNLN